MSRPRARASGRGRVTRSRDFYGALVCQLAGGARSGASRGCSPATQPELSALGVVRGLACGPRGEGLAVGASGARTSVQSRAKAIVRRQVRTTREGHGLPRGTAARQGRGTPRGAWRARRPLLLLLLSSAWVGTPGASTEPTLPNIKALTGTSPLGDGGGGSARACTGGC
jgi:hypothetical protein